MTIRGGKRAGAGRKPNSGKFREKTKSIRVPESCIEPLNAWLNQLSYASENLLSRTKEKINTSLFSDIFCAASSPTSYEIPFYDCSVSAGFPIPVDDHFSITMDLNKHLVQNAPATFFVRTSGDSMVDAGIRNGDLLVVDRSLTAKNNDIVIAAVNGDLTVKRFTHQNGKAILKAENPSFANIELTNDMAVSFWGVVTNVIHNLRN